MSPNSLDPRAQRAYRRRAAPYLLPAWLLLAAGLGALFGQGDATTVSQIINVTWIEDLWLVSYTVAAVLLIVGLMWPRPSIELVGDWLALWALLVNLGCLLAVRGLFGSGLAVFSYAITMTVLSLRISDLVSIRHGLDRRRRRNAHLVGEAEERLDDRDSE